MDGERVSRERRARPRLSSTTIEDVARAAGVSRQTVTRAMNDMAGISAATRERVLRAAGDLDYRPSRSSRALARGRHDTLGIALTDLTDPFYPPLAAATMTRAAQLGKDVVVIDVATSQNPTRLLTGLTRQVDAVIAYLGRHESWTDVLSDVPTVWVGAPGAPLPPGGAQVVPDPTTALAEAAAHLKAGGVAHAIVLDAWTRSSVRTEAIIEALARAGVRTERRTAGGPGYHHGHRAAQELLPHVVPDAIVCWNDPIAIGALAALAEGGVGVPDQVQVLGIDGLAVGAYTTPALSTVELDPSAIAATSVDLALELQARGSDAPATLRHRVHHTFVPRSTTRPVRDRTAAHVPTDGDPASP